MTAAPGGPGPVPPATALSDRAAEESFTGHVMLDTADVLQRALRSLDRIVEIEGQSGVGDTSPLGPAPAVRTVSGAASGESSSAGPVAADPGPARPTGQDRREAILDGASALFAERGYHGASLRDISKQVGISHPGMLHHFASKETLLNAVIDRLEAHAQGLLDSTDQLSGSSVALLAALEGPWSPSQHSMALLATLSAEIVNPEHPGRMRIARLRLVHEHILETILESLAERGELRSGTEPAFVARTAFSLLLGQAVREKSVRTLQRRNGAVAEHDVRQFVTCFLGS